jgi:hypothetical protein
MILFARVIYVGGYLGHSRSGFIHPPYAHSKSFRKWLSGSRMISRSFSRTRLDSGLLFKTFGSCSRFFPR